jgi:hypothetical protein
MFIAIFNVNTLKNQSAERQHPQCAVYGYLQISAVQPRFILDSNTDSMFYLKSRNGLCVLCSLHTLGVLC